jgi:glycosyltransferase involved in cell wall biosynthesis
VSALLLKDHDIELIIAGRGEYEDYFKSLVTDMGLEQRVTFTGFIDHELMPAFLSGIDIFAMPSFTESFGVAALEASATGIPVVATKVGGVPEVVVHGTTGLLVERGDISQLADALEKLILDPGLREKMGRAGRAFVEDNYRWESNLKAMSDLYAEVIR